ncbi:MAG: Stp1/IreP family PP2C-type Ser/Thr phosphatase [Myxococcales bacterium]|nr:Stp1/IreP family PP2C-type Ser/Thr phosphatase [Myxococcales bacterium]
MRALGFIAAGHTDVGRHREVNEDAYALIPEERLWVLADGMGGHASGQVASQMAIEKICDFIARWRHEPDFEWPFEIMESRSHAENSLVNAVRVANVRIYNRSQVDEECEGMGTTVVVMTYSDDVGFVIAHVGDSRCYRLRRNEFRQLTEDHSLVNHLMRFFHLSEADAKARAGSNVIVRAVGLEDDVDADLTVDQPEVGDLYMACSDGLSDLVEDWIVQQILIGNQDAPEEAARALVRAANQAGGTDNITVLIVKVVGG